MCLPSIKVYKGLRGSLFYWCFCQPSLFAISFPLHLYLFSKSLTSLRKFINFPTSQLFLSCLFLLLKLLKFLLLSFLCKHSLRQDRLLFVGFCIPRYYTLDIGHFFTLNRIFLYKSFYN